MLIKFKLTLQIYHKKKNKNVIKKIKIDLKKKLKISKKDKTMKQKL